MKASMLLVLAAGFLFLPVALAQDPVKVAPKNFKVLAEDDRVRVIEFTAKKGEKIPMHSHPAIVVYIIEAGKTKFTLADGRVIEADNKPGDAFIREPVTHAHEHLSDTRAIVVELKK